MKSFGNNEQSAKCGTVLEWCVDGVKALVGAIVALALVFAVSFLQGCGGGSGDGAPVYDENGNCAENCDGNGDASVMPVDGNIYPPGDTCDHDGCGGSKQDYIAPPCKVPTDTNIKKMCMPQWAKKAGCDLYTTPPSCYQGFFEGQPCATHSDCQKVPCDAWPPEVCWDICVLTAYEWDCPASVWEPWSELKEENGYCLAIGHSGGYYKPGNGKLYLQYPAEGEPEDDVTISPDEKSFVTCGGTGCFTCTRIEPQEE